MRSFARLKCLGSQLCALVLGLFWLLGTAYSQQAIPNLNSRVTDLTATLSASQIAELDSKLATFESKKGAQIAVLIVSTTEPETIEQYSIRVVDAWQLGRKKISDGVLLLIAKDDRRVRIEVGYGLEGAIPDLVAGRVINTIIVPRFKSAAFYQGIVEGLDAILALISGEPLPEVEQQGRELDNFIILLIFGIPFVLFAKIVRPVDGAVSGSLFVSILSLLFQPSFLALLLFFVLLIFVNFFTSSDSRSAWRGIGGSFGGGFGGGGFSGGGGGFGGGGASGRW